MLLEGDPAESGGRLDLSTGDCRPTFTEGLDDAGPEVEEVDDPERWLRVPASGSRAGYRDMELFIGGLDDAALAGDERAWRRYHRLSDERQRGRARAWPGRGGLLPAPCRTTADRMIEGRRALTAQGRGWGLGCIFGKVLVSVGSRARGPGQVGV